MNELLYSAFDLACIINNFDLSENVSAELIYKLWNEEKNFLERVFTIVLSKYGCEKF